MLKVARLFDISERKILATHTVTLKILSSLSALRTDRPKFPAIGLKWVQIISKTDPEMTRQSKRLNEDSK